MSRLSAWLAASCLATACAGAGAGTDSGAAARAVRGSGSVCPTRPGTNVTRIDVFDGDPADLAYLAPDDEQRAPDTYTVEALYDAGRFVTIRCHYGSASVDIELTQRVAQCRFSGGDAHSALACK